MGEAQLDEREAVVGDVIDRTLRQSIERHDKVIVVISESSLSSQWAECEVRSALDAERTLRGSLLPINIDKAPLASNGTWVAAVRRDRFIGDFSDWRNESTLARSQGRLLSALRRQDKQLTDAT